MRIEIRIDDVEPLSGQVSADGEQPLQFNGWLSLLSLLERLTHPAEPQRPGSGVSR